MKKTDKAHAQVLAESKSSGNNAKHRPISPNVPTHCARNSLVGRPAASR
ncbi:hypothetical protein ACIRU3_38490 [Streptomyces sp. NPDC101151]